MIEEVRNIEWQRCGSLYMTRLGYDNYVNHVVALYAGSDVLSYGKLYGKLEIYQNAAVVRKGEERIRIFRVYCGGWITLSRIVRLLNDEIDYNVNYLVGYNYSNYDDEEQRDAIVVIQGNVLIEYIIDGDFIVTARIDENGRICEFPGVIETVIK